MPGQDYPDRTAPSANSPDTDDRRPPLSRRSVLHRAAGIGAVGLVVAAGGGTTAAVLSARSHKDTSAQPQGSSAIAATANGSGPGPIVIYMADSSSGEMEIFAGTGQTRHTNHAMAAMVASMAPR
jgi:hypothetical protein